MNPQVFMVWGSVPAAALPRTWAEALADRAGDLSWRVAGTSRATAASNLSLLLGTRAAEAQTRGAFRTYARYYLSIMRLAHQGSRRAVGSIRWAGTEALDASLARGHGALVLSAHLGNWDVAGIALAARYGGLCVFAEALVPPRLFDFYRRTRARHGVRVAPVGSPSRLPIEVLRRNGLLGLVADRPFGLRRERVRCGSGALDMPAGGIRLALRAGAAIHTIFGVREAGGFLVRLGPDLTQTLPGSWGEAARLHAVGESFAAELRAIVHRHPEQWCLLHPMHALQVAAADRRGAA